MSEKKNENKALSEADKLSGAITRFVKSWQEIPPLVRASVGASLVASLDRHLDGLLYAAYNEREDMPRRQKVTTLFANGFEAHRQLLVELANLADDDAVSKGIDLDTHYEGTTNALVAHSARRRRARENEAADRRTLAWKKVEADGTETLSAEVDGEVLAELGKSRDESQG